VHASQGCEPVFLQGLLLRHEAIYEGVKVKSVNIMNYTGKLKRVGKNPVRGRRSNWKKAIVTLAEGTIELA